MATTVSVFRMCELEEHGRCGGQSQPKGENDLWICSCVCHVVVARAHRRKIRMEESG